MSTPSSFNWQRFCRVAHHQWVECRNENVKMLLGFALTFFFIILISTYDYMMGEVGWVSGNYEGAIFFLLFAAGLMSIIGASMIFSNLQTKQARINFFMLPATNLEKYLVRFLYATVGVLAGIILTFLATDMLLWGVRLLLQGGSTPIIYEMAIGAEMVWDGIKFFIRESKDQIVVDNSLLLIPTIITSTLSTYATYILGGTFFRRYAFLLTTATMWVAGMLLGLGLITFFTVAKKADYQTFSSYVEHLRDTSPLFWSSLGIVINLLWTIGCLWISYRMFRRSNVILNRSFGL